MPGRSPFFQDPAELRASKKDRKCSIGTRSLAGALRASVVMYVPGPRQARGHFLDDRGRSWRNRPPPSRAEGGLKSCGVNRTGRSQLRRKGKSRF